MADAVGDGVHPGADVFLLNGLLHGVKGFRHGAGQVRDLDFGAGAAADFQELQGGFVDADLVPQVGGGYAVVALDQLHHPAQLIQVGVAAGHIVQPEGDAEHPLLHVVADDPFNLRLLQRVGLAGPGAVHHILADAAVAQQGDKVAVGAHLLHRLGITFKVVPVGPDFHIAVVLLQADEAIAQVIIQLVLFVARHDGVAAVAVDQGGDPFLQVKVVTAVVKADPFLVNMGVDEAWDDVFALGIVNLLGVLCDVGGDAYHLIPLDRHIRPVGRVTGSVYHQTIANQKIIHMRPLLCLVIGLLG